MNLFYKSSCCSTNAFGVASPPFVQPIIPRVAVISSVSSEAAAGAASGGRKTRQPRRKDRDLSRAQKPSASQRNTKGPASLSQLTSISSSSGTFSLEGGEDAVLSAVASARNVRELLTLHTFLLQQQSQQHTQQQQQSFSSTHAHLPAKQAVHFLARLSQLSPSPAINATAHLDTHVAYDPLPSFPPSTQNDAVNSSEPATGYVLPLMPQHPTRQAWQQTERPAAIEGAGRVAPEQGTRMSKEEQAEDAASIGAAKSR